MSRKQVDFIFRLMEYSSVEPEKSTFANSEYIRVNYLSQGWEVLATEVVRAEANSVFLGISFVKYVDAVIETASPEKAKK